MLRVTGLSGGALVTITSTHRLSLLAAGASLAILGAAAPAAAQESAAGQDFWSGWYLGLNAGGAWGDNKLTRRIEAGNGAIVIPPADAALINAPIHNNNNETGFTGGLEGGYNWVTQNNWLIGVEGEWVALSTKSKQLNTFTSGIVAPIFPPPPP